jgi:hypothetical protein
MLGADVSKRRLYSSKEPTYEVRAKPYLVLPFFRRQRRPMRIKKTISLERPVFEAMEKIRGTRQQFTSQFINDVLKEKLGLANASIHTKEPAVPAKEATGAANSPEKESQHVCDIL